jgi:DNA glycosylase AlkZ-like
MRMSSTGLLGPRFEQPRDVVHAHLAMQSQDYGPAKWSIGQRMAGVVDADVEKRVSEGAILRTHVLRPTWHFVERRDLRWLMALSGPRIQKAIEPRYQQLDLDIKTRSRAEGLISKVLEGGTHATRRELGEMLRKSHIDPAGQRLPHLLMHCELVAVTCSGRMRGKDQTYALFDERVPKGRSFDRDQAIIQLVERYLASHGPATVKDMSWWSGLTMTDLRRALEALGDQVVREDVDGLTLWSRMDEFLLPTRRKTPVVELLQAYDELVVGYTESRYLGDPRAAQVRAAYREPGRPNGAVMLDSQVAGQWRQSTGPKKVEVEVLLFESLSERAGAALERALNELGRFFGKEVHLSSRVL